MIYTECSEDWLIYDNSDTCFMHGLKIQFYTGKTERVVFQRATVYSFLKGIAFPRKNESIVFKGKQRKTDENKTMKTEYENIKFKDSIPDLKPALNCPFSDLHPQ